MQKNNEIFFAVDFDTNDINFFRFLFLNLKAGIVIIDENGIIKAVNREYVKIYHYSASELIDNPFTIIVSKKDKNGNKKIHDDFIKIDNEFPNEFKVQKKNGEIIDILAGASLFIDSNKKKYKIIYISEITEIKKKDEAIENLSSFPRNNPNPVFELDYKGHFTYWNHSARAVFKKIPKPKNLRKALVSEIKKQYNGPSHTTFIKNFRIQRQWFRFYFNHIPSQKKFRIYAFNDQRYRSVLEELKRKEITYRTLFNNMKDGVMMVNHIGNFQYKIIDINPRMQELEKIDQEKPGVLGKDKHFHSSYHKNVMQKIDEVNKNGKYFEFQTNAKNDQGKLFYREFYIYRLPSKEIILIVSDITEKQNKEHRRMLTSHVFEYTTEGIVITDKDTNILEVNDAFMRINGYSREELISQTPKKLKSGWQDVSFYESMWEEIEVNGKWAGEIWDRKKDGSLYAQWLTIVAVKDDFENITNYIGITNEITENKVTEERIRKMAYYDPLTELPNRAFIEEKLNFAIQVASSASLQTALLFIDLDKFKQINDSFGHHKGDLFLQEVAKRGSSALKENYIFGRLGGDEFVIIIDTFQESSEVLRIAEEFAEKISSPYIIENTELLTSASIGIAIFPQDGSTPEELMKNADTAMYKAKESGRNAIRFYEKSMNETAIEKIRFDNMLRKATEKNEWFLLYQPKIATSSLKMTGVEALIRWDQPELGLVSPGDFIPTAEKSHVIIDMGKWVLNRAMDDLKNWKQIHIAVNISARHFENEKILIDLEESLQKNNFPPERLEIEITESTIMNNVNQSIDVLKKIKQMGIKIAIDDFGTGYSSLNYLKMLPIDRLKIDQSFIFNIPQNAADTAITETIIAMGKTLNLEITAEGVENYDIIQFLKEKEIDEMQGYYFSKPIPFYKLEKLIDYEFKL